MFAHFVFQSFYANIAAFLSIFFSILLRHCSRYVLMPNSLITCKNLGHFVFFLERNLYSTEEGIESIICLSHWLNGHGIQCGWKIAVRVCVHGGEAHWWKCAHVFYCTMVYCYYVFLENIILHHFVWNDF